MNRRNTRRDSLLEQPGVCLSTIYVVVQHNDKFRRIETTDMFDPIRLSEQHACVSSDLPPNTTLPSHHIRSGSRFQCSSSTNTFDYVRDIRYIGSKYTREGAQRHKGEIKMRQNEYILIEEKGTVFFLCRSPKLEVCFVFELYTGYLQSSC